VPITCPSIPQGTREKYLLEDLGSLLVCLEYQAVANRMKVMIRKAANLPHSDRLIGEPGGQHARLNMALNNYYVVFPVSQRHIEFDSDHTRFYFLFSSAYPEHVYVFLGPSSKTNRCPIVDSLSDS